MIAGLDVAPIAADPVGFEAQVGLEYRRRDQVDTDGGVPAPNRYGVSLGAGYRARWWLVSLRGAYSGYLGRDLYSSIDFAGTGAIAAPWRSFKPFAGVTTMLWITDDLGERTSDIDTAFSLLISAGARLRLGRGGFVALVGHAPIATWWTDRQRVFGVSLVFGGAPAP
jgi:hypothetical protein